MSEPVTTTTHLVVSLDVNFSWWVVICIAIIAMSAALAASAINDAWGKKD
jgi:hypothetical protein